MVNPAGVNFCRRSWSARPGAMSFRWPSRASSLLPSLALRLFFFPWEVASMASVAFKLYLSRFVSHQPEVVVDISHRDRERPVSVLTHRVIFLAISRETFLIAWCQARGDQDAPSVLNWKAFALPIKPLVGGMTECRYCLCIMLISSEMPQFLFVSGPHFPSCLQCPTVRTPWCFRRDRFWLVVASPHREVQLP